MSGGGEIFARLAGAGERDLICRADEAGILMVPGESEAAFRERLGIMERESAALSAETAQLPPVSAAVRAEALRIVGQLYGIGPEWVVTVHSSRETGHFSAGVTGFTEKMTPAVFLSDAFLKRSCHRGYTAAETLAHELVHAARAAFPDSVYDEYFPCQVHASRFRRSAGNFFRRWYLPVLFVAGLCAAAFYPWCALIPVLLLLNEVRLRRRIEAAAETLRAAGLRPEPVLLRLSDGEIGILAAGKLPEFMRDTASARREMLFCRFSL